jgi:hypothetical protein
VISTWADASVILSALLNERRTSVSTRTLVPGTTTYKGEGRGLLTAVHLPPSIFPSTARSLRGLPVVGSSYSSSTVTAGT